MNRRNVLGGWLFVTASLAIAACANGDASTDDSLETVPPKDAAADARADHAPGTGPGAGDDASAPSGDDAGDGVDSAPGDDSAPEHDATTPIDAGHDAIVAPTQDANVPDTNAPDTNVPDTSVGGNCPAGSPVVVNEVQSEGATAGDEFVELYNPNDCTFSLSGFTLRYSSSGGSAPATKWTGAASDAIGPHGYVVVKGAGYTGASGAVIGALSGSSGVLAKAAGAIGLHDASGTLVDGVAYGSSPSNPEGEGAPAPALVASESIGRSSTSADTNDNATDFTLKTTPTPGARN